MGTLVCTVTLDKNDGVTVEVDNADSKITQTITMDKNGAVTIKVKGASDTSTIVQKSDSVVVTCKDFTVDADTITCKSKKATSMTAMDTMTLKSTNEMKLSTDAAFTGSAVQDMKLSGMNVKATGNMNVELTGNMAAKLVATGGQATVQGMMLNLQGDAEGQLSAPVVNVSGDATLNLQSDGICNVEGSMTSVAGDMVTVG